MRAAAVASVAVTALALASAPSVAWGSLGAVVYVVKAGDTPESLAYSFYGSRAQAVFIREANRLKPTERLHAGQTLRVPGAFKIKVRKGDTLERLSRRFLDDARRAWYLGLLNGLRVNDVLREGIEIRVPTNLAHRAHAPESLPTLAKEFYGDAQQSKMLSDYNFREYGQGSVLVKGERIVLPVPYLLQRSSTGPSASKPSVPLPPGLPVAMTTDGTHPPAMTGATPGIAALVAAPERPLDTGSPDGGADVAERPSPQLDTRARRVGDRLRMAEQAWREGTYEDVVDLLTRLLLEEEPVEAQRAAIHRLRGFAYVAIGHEEPALSDFREVLRRDPAATLDAATVSPRIRVVFDRARTDR